MCFFLYLLIVSRLSQGPDGVGVLQQVGVREVVEYVRLLAQTYAELVEGQTLELRLDFDTDHSADAYFRVIEGKTASLIRTSARLGAMAADCEPCSWMQPARS